MVDPGSCSTRSFDSSRDESPNADSVTLAGALRLHREDSIPVVGTRDRWPDTDPAMLAESLRLQDSLRKAKDAGFSTGCCTGALDLAVVGGADLSAGGAECIPDQLKTVGNWVTSKLN